MASQQQSRCDALVTETHKHLEGLDRHDLQDLLAKILGTARFQKDKRVLENARFYWPKATVPAWLAKA